MLIRLTHANPYPPRRSIGCRKRVVTQIHRPDRPETPRPRNALAVPSPQAKATSRGSTAKPGRAGPGRSGAESALCKACNGFTFAWQTPIYARCAPAATPPPFPGDACGSTRSGRSDVRLRPRPPTRPRPSNPHALRMSSGSRASG